MLMALTKRTWLAGNAAPLALFFALAGCGGDTDSSPPDGGLRGDVLAALGVNAVVPQQEAFATDAFSLESALADAASGEATREAAQQAWRDAIDSWQQIEMMQFGPAGSRVTVMGGESLRARIYSWPVLSLCEVDRQTAGDDYDDPDALAAAPGAPLGLWAIEYLLFTEDSGNQCSPLDPLNDEGIWDGLGDVPQRRLTHAASLATLARQAAAELVDSWSTNGGNFIQEMESPGRSGAVYGSAQEGLNAVSDAMFYLDTEAKDMKLGRPAGLTACESEPCLFESRWAFHGKENLIANLRAFQVLFLGVAPGTDALGFDDLLIDMGATDVATDMTAAIAGAITATAAIPGNLQDAAESDTVAVEDAHDAIREVTTLLKNDFLSVLDLELPDRAAGDND